MVLNDTTRAAIIAFVQSAFPVLQLAGVVNLTSDGIATIMLLVGNGLTLLMLILKHGQQEGPESPEV